jgi:hypothetical protein
MGFRIGDNSTSTQFNDNGATIVSPVSNDINDPRVRVTTQAFRVYLNLRNNVADTAIFSGTWIWQTRAAFDLDQDDLAVVTFTSPTFKGMGTFTLGSSITGAATWDDVGPVVFADTGVDVDGSSLKNPNGNHLLEMTAGAMDIADMRFESYALKHAILIDTVGTYNLSDVFFDQSGTNDIQNTSGGHVIINVLGTGTLPTVTNTSGTSEVNVTFTLTLTDIPSGANATIVNSSTRTELQHTTSAGVDITYDHSGGEIVDILLMGNTIDPNSSDIFDLTLPSSSSSIKFNTTIDLNYENP